MTTPKSALKHLQEVHGHDCTDPVRVTEYWPRLNTSQVIIIYTKYPIISNTEQTRANTS